MSRPLRVLWLAKGLGRGGAEHLLATSAKHLDSNRFEVEVCYLLPWKDALVADLEGAGLVVHCLNQRRAYDPRWLWRLRRLVRAHDYDIVHTHMPVPAVGARLVLGPNRPVLVHTEHNLWHRYRPLTYWSNALTYHRNSAVIAVSHAVAATITPPLHRSAQAPVEIIHHGIEKDAMSHGLAARQLARARLGIPADRLVVGTVGNFTPKKDQRTLLDAMAILRRTFPGIALVLVGAGPLESDLRRQVRARGLIDTVIFTGSRHDVPHILPAFDVFALSSLFEGLSIALVEAMASGVPCVATRVGGVPEVLRNGEQGLLVEPSDPRALAGAIEALLTDDGLRAQMSTAAIRRALDFDIGRALRRIEDIYDEATVAR